MARFILVQNDTKCVAGINSEQVEYFRFEKEQDSPTVSIFMVSGKTFDVFFETDEEAMSFIEKNFILFNK